MARPGLLKRAHNIQKYNTIGKLTPQKRENAKTRKREKSFRVVKLSKREKNKNKKNF